MIIVMRAGASPADIEQVTDRVTALGFQVHLSQGTERTIIGVIGDTDALDEREIEALPGVSQVVRIRKDD